MLSSTLIKQVGSNLEGSLSNFPIQINPIKEDIPFQPVEHLVLGIGMIIGGKLLRQLLVTDIIAIIRPGGMQFVINEPC